VIWKIEFDIQAAKEFKKIDKNAQTLIRNYLWDKILTAPHPQNLGKPLKHQLSGLGRYKVDKCSIIYSIESANLVVLVVRIAKRDEVYDD
jgi:mRNA interferase RelE/StbE